MGGGSIFAAKTKVNKKCSHHCTTNGVSNALMRAFHCRYRIGGGGGSTMGWLVPNFGKGGSVGILVILVEVCFLTSLVEGVPAPTHLRMPDSGQIRPEHSPVQNGSRVPACRKGGTSGMFRPESVVIRPEQECCPGFRHPKNRNKSRNVQPRTPWASILA